MPGLTTYAANKVLDHLHGKTAYTMPTNYLGLFTVAPTDAGGGTEVSGGSYARKATAGADWNAAAANSASNANALAFAQATANWGDVVAFGEFDASAAGNLLWWDWLQPVTGAPHAQKPFTADTGDLITSPGHGYSAGDKVVFTAEYGGTLPTGLTGNTLYYVIASGLTSDAFKVSATLGGSALDLTAVGGGMVRKVEVRTVNNGDTVQFAAGAIADVLT